MNERVRLVLRNPAAPEEKIDFFIDLLPNSLSKRWFQSLKELMGRPHVLEKHTSFLGFLNGSRGKAYLSNRLNEAADRISRHLGEAPWNTSYPITSRADPDQIDPRILNEFHHHFEILMGNTFDISPYYKSAPTGIRHAITQLNYLVHELEAYYRSEKNFLRNGKIYPFSLVNFLEHSVHRFALEPEDYRHFTLENTFGDVQIAYCQLGKTPYEAWRDNDENIFDSNMNGIQYYSANFNIRWGHSSNPEIQRKTIIEPFHEWLEKKGIDLSQKTYFSDHAGKWHGLGFLNIGKVDTSSFGTGDVAAIQKLLSRHCDIHKVCLHEGDTITEKSYDFLLQDEDYTERIRSCL